MTQHNTVSLLYFVLIEREKKYNVNILLLFNHYLRVSSVLLHHKERVYDYKRGKAKTCLNNFKRFVFT